MSKWFSLRWDGRATGGTGGQHRRVGGRWSRRRPGIAAAVIGVAALALAGSASSALADSTNLLPNGGFEGSAGSGSLSGWKAQGATLSLVADGVGGGHAGRAALTGTSTSYQIYASPRPVMGAAQGTQYSAGGEARSDAPGKYVCLQLREYAASGAKIGSLQKCQRATSTWAALPTVNYTTTQAGSSIAFTVMQTGATSGDSFEADDLTLTSSSSSPPPPEVVALWHMDETSGTTMHDSIGSHDGTLTSVTIGQPGFSGTAYRFNGSVSKGYVSVPSAPDLDPGTGDFMFEIHVNTSTVPTSGDYDVMRKGIYSSQERQEYKIEIQKSGQASCAFRGSSGNAEIMAGPSIADGQWHDIRCSKTSTQVTLTVDGQPFSMNAAIGSISSTAPLTIGAHPGFDYYNGLVDEASVTQG